jgi:hypothetical protein
MSSLRLSALGLAIVGVIVACVTAPEDSRVVATPPDRNAFPPVADLLMVRCGTLDCHGMKERNLRLYGSLGLRLVDRPTSKPNKTTPDEYTESFNSVVGLEPEILSQVVQEGGANPERLTLIRKPRNTEHHKGLQMFKPGDDGDRCVTSWLAGHTDTAACATATWNGGDPDAGPNALFLQTVLQ